MSEVTNHLGEGVKLTLEVEAESAEGFNERTYRVVSENASRSGSDRRGVRVADRRCWPCRGHARIHL